MKKKDIEINNENIKNNDSGEEVTEELGNTKSSTENRKSKKRFLILGVMAGVVILGVMTYLILSQMKTAEINKALDLGEKYLEDGKYEEAILAFDDVIAIDAKNVSAYEGKGATYFGMDNYTEAEAQLETAKSIDFTDNGKILMADVYLKTDRKDQGLSLVEEVVKNQPDDTKTVIQITDLYSQINENTKSIELLDQQIANTKDKGELRTLYDTLIPICVKAGKSDADIKAYLEKAASSIGEYTNAFYQNYALYAPILEEYRKAGANKFSPKVINSLPDVTQTFSPYEYKEPLYYMLEDLSGDAIPELVIAGYDPNNTKSVYGDIQTEYNIIDTYRIKNGKPERIFISMAMGVRARYTICENQIIKSSGSGGAASQHFNFFKLDGSDYTVNQNIEYDGWNGPKFFLNDTNHNNTQLTKEEAFTIINSYIPKSDINWIAL